MFTLAELSRQFPNSRYHADQHIVTWHPDGVLDNDCADRAVAFMELAEKIEGKPFNRYVDMTGHSRIQIDLDHIVRLARRRRSYRGPRVKTAFYAVRLISLTVARMYQELMVGSNIEVCIFPEREAAAAWLGVPETILPKQRRKSS